MNPIAKRTLTALSVAAVVIAALVYIPFAYLRPVLIALVALVHLEFSQIVAKKHEIMIWPGVALGLGYLLVGFYAPNAVNYIPPVAAVFTLLAFAALFSRVERPLVALGTTTLGFLYIPYMLRYFFALVDPSMPPPAGICESFWLLYTVAIVKISDMGGFAFGLGSKKLFGGNHKMCPSISPGKSWEGLIGSVFGSCLIPSLFMPLTGFGFAKSLALGVTAALVGTLGDLVESRFKREAGVKDSSTMKLTNGMGGFLDMFDSLVFAPAVIWVLIRVI